MKKVFLLPLMCLLIGEFSSAQMDTTTSPALSQSIGDQLLLKKSRNQKTAGWALLIGGAALGITGVIVANAAMEKDSFTGFLSSQAQTGYILATAGGASMIASIPFFISAGKNRHRAYAAIDNQSAFIPGHFRSGQSFISYGIKINLNSP